MDSSAIPLNPFEVDEQYDGFYLVIAMRHEYLIMVKVWTIAVESHTHCQEDE